MSQLRRIPIRTENQVINHGGYYLVTTWLPPGFHLVHLPAVFILVRIRYFMELRVVLLSLEHGHPGVGSRLALRTEDAPACRL